MGSEVGEWRFSQWEKMEGRIGSGKGGGRTTRWESGCQHRQYPSSSINRRLCTDGIEWNGNWEQGNNISMGNIVGIFSDTVIWKSTSNQGTGQACCRG